MSDEALSPVPAVFPSRERSALVAQALSEAARRARFSTKRRRNLAIAGYRARRSDRLFRLLGVLAFVITFVLPVGLAGAYYGFIASGQYVAEARFTVRGGMPPAMEKLGALAGAPGELIIQDTQVIMNYLQSRALVETLDKKVGLERVFAGKEIDWYARLGRAEPIETIVKYWKSQLDLSVQMPSGIVVLAVRAFKPDDAVALVDAALAASDAIVNRMNDRMTGDAVALAETERKRALEHLATTRVALERARNAEGILDAAEASKALDGLVTGVREEVLRLRQQYESQRRFVEAEAPQLRNLQAKISAAEQEVVKLEAQRTSTADGSSSARILSGSMSRLDYAALENSIAEKIYAGSLAALEQARLASETKLMYINIFVRPVAAEEAKYPRRWLIVGLVALGSAVAWGIAAGLLALVRTRVA